MTREELRGKMRGMIGGYATGSLTEAERKALFEAALEDQELFDELAREQAFKEAIEEPGAKQRLLAAVAPRTIIRPWWRQTWSWAALAAACVAAITGIVLLRPGAKLQEVARIVSPPIVAPPIDAPRIVAPPIVAPPIDAPRIDVPRIDVPKVQQPAPPEPKATETRPTVPPAAELAQPRAQAPKVNAPTVEAGKQSTVGTLEFPRLDDGPAPVQLVPAPLPAVLGGQAFAGNSTGAVAAGTLAAPAPGPAPAPAAAGGGGGGRGGRGGAARAFARLAARPQRFAFDYSITPEGALRIVPASNGFLSVYSNDGNTARSLFFNRSLTAGIAVEIPLPADCVQATAVFSAREQAPGLVSFVGPVDPPSGTKSDPNPGPESQLFAVVPIPRKPA